MADDARLAELGDTLRELDPDGHLALLYAPADKRAALAALWAFAAEAAAVRERIREPMAGEVRLQWWRDAVLAGAPTGHPVADALIAAMAAHNLPPAPLVALLDARVFDLYDDPIADRAMLEGYLGETRSAVMQLSLLILDPAKAAAFADAAGHAGCARGVAEIIAQLPKTRARGQCFVPLDLLAAAGTDRDGFVSGSDKAAAGNVIHSMVALGREHHASFLQSAGRLPAQLRPAFLQLAVVPAILDKAEKAGAGALDRAVQAGPLARQVGYLRRASRGW